MKVIQAFKDGKYNVLVATSIGEEGLDIGDVDLIICYDTNSSPIRMLQRMGRTGRKREGRVVFLCTEGKEERDHVKSQDNYEKIQRKIAAGDEFDFDLNNSPRILPPEFQPDCVKKEIFPPDETPDDLELKVDRRKKLPKPQKDWSLPENVQIGFVRASAIGKRKRQPSPIEVESLFVHPDTLKSPFMTEEEEDRVRRQRVHVSPTPQRIDVLDMGTTGSVPASSLRKRLVCTRKSMRKSKSRSNKYDDDDFSDLASTPPNLFPEEPQEEAGLTDISVNIGRRIGPNSSFLLQTPGKGAYDGVVETLSSPDSLPDISAELFFGKKETPAKKSEGKDSDDEYGLPSDFDVTPRKRIRIADFSDDE